MKNLDTKPARAGANNREVCARARISKQINDLQWRISFTQMKLNDWPASENCRWLNLVRMQERAKQELLSVAF